jgi:hypothetical protein
MYCAHRHSNTPAHTLAAHLVHPRCVLQSLPILLEVNNKGFNMRWFILHKVHHCGVSVTSSHFMGHSGLADCNLCLPLFLWSKPWISPFSQKKQCIQPHHDTYSCCFQLKGASGCHLQHLTNACWFSNLSEIHLEVIAFQVFASVFVPRVSLVASHHFDDRVHSV